MSKARNSILAAIHAANGLAKPADEVAAEAAALVAEPDRIRPGFAGQSNRARFIEKATSERVTATVSEIDSMDRLPSEVAHYLAAFRIGRLAMQPREALTALDWTGIETHHDPAPDETAALSIADLAVAETGSVLFLSGPDAPVLMNFLPLHHIVAVPAARIHRHIEDAFTVRGTVPSDQPRLLTLVTGTSGTADIEAINIRGAHGPRYMHLVIVGPGDADQPGS